MVQVSRIYRVFGEVVAVFIFCDYGWPRVALCKANFSGCLNVWF